MAVFREMNSKKPEALMAFSSPPRTESNILDNKWPIMEVRGHQTFSKSAR